MKTGIRNSIVLILLLTVLSPATLFADPGNQYCITPPFITAGVKPNLLLMIDNSASMYDLAYTDTTIHNYCANDPSTSCATTGAVCSGAAICKITATTTSETTISPIACTANSNCVAATGICPSGSTCSWSAGDTCNTGKGQCKKSTMTVTLTSTEPKACTADSDCTASGDSCNNRCTATTTPCMDSTYSNTGNYPGYLKQTGTYCYSTKSSKTTCTYSGSYDEFDPIASATMPASCTYGGSGSATPYVCVNTAVDAVSGKEYVSQFVGSGRFLNWLAMSKFDIQKSILTGGKYRVDFGGDLIGESRGCSGRKFIKTLPLLPAISFGIRGGSAGIGDTSQATQYGQTFIEIYKGTYNAGACTAALNNWQNVTDTSMGPLQVNTKNCIGGASNNDQLVAANQTIHDCFWYFNGHGLSNLQPLKNVCGKIYQTTGPGEITDPAAPDAICSNNLDHAASLVDGNTNGYLGSCFTAGVWDDTCALRENKDFCQGMAGAGAVADPSSESVVPQTVQNVPGFVMELGLASLEMINDYTRLSPVPANATKGFPLAVFDTTNFNPWPPTGLIQKHQNNIRFGAMTFQDNGSGSECAQNGYCSATSTNPGVACTADAGCTGGGKCIFSIPCTKTCSNATYRQCYSDPDCSIKDPVTGVITTGTCGNLAKADGGKFIAYVGAGYCSVTTTTPCTVDSECAALIPTGQYCNPSIGDHNSGLLRQIDDIQATSWTPFAEGFYNAMGYFARANDYSVSPPTSRIDANFAALPASNTATNYLNNKNPSQFRCQSNNLLLITDGMSTADQNNAPEGLATLYAAQIPYILGTTTYKPGDTGYDSAKNHGYDTTNKCPTYAGSRSLSSLAWIAKNRDIKTLSTSTASTTVPQSASESITTYVVYSGPETSGQPELCDPKMLMKNSAVNGGTDLLAVTNPAELEAKLDSALSAVAAKAASGTAASILSNSEGSGANILQAVFYPKKIFDNSTYVNWIGEMQNLWYFVDPYIQNSTIREDSDGDLKLNIVSDYITRFTFDSSADRTMVQRYNDADGDGAVTDGDKVGGLIDPDYVKSIWRAGMKLWARNDSGTTARTIFTGANSSAGSTPQVFAANGTFNALPAVWTALQIPDTTQIPGITDAQRQALTTKLINYIRGTDQVNDTFPCLNADCTYRKRAVTMGVCSGNNQKRCTSSTVAADCPSGNTCTNITREWKLGDIISSTPRVQSTVRLNTYNQPFPGGYSDKSYEAFINTTDYANRGMVYVGANDGMLHAFKLGTLSVKASGFQKASLTGDNLGEEKWAYIPKNSLPYLKYSADKDYSHLYFVDGRTVIFDASIGDTGAGACVSSSYWECDKRRNGSSPNTWRTVVIAGMGLGGASRNNVVAETCTEGATGSCVKTPISGIGYSSYFALDVTDPEDPKFLWEFSDNNLGYSTSAPAIVRVGDKEKNGRWFAVFGNGPMGPIDSGTHQFKAQSTNHLRFFVVDLRTGALVATLNNTESLGLTNAFTGTLLGASIDTDRRDPSKTGYYQDDAIYAGYTKLGSDGKWTDGGVVRIMTKEDQNPANWVVSKVIDGIGAVTTGIARTQDTRAGADRNLWLYFGTGRYFYRDAVALDDNDNPRALFGIKEPCYNTVAIPGNVLDGTCTETLSLTKSLFSDELLSGATVRGWRIDLDAATADKVCSVDNGTTCTLDSDCPSGQTCNKYGAERVVTDTVALTNGTVFFTSFKPTLDICGYGGNSYLWGVKYNTGGQAAASSLTGKALIQLSTGEFKEVDLSSAFTDKGNRRMASPMTGKPPSDAPPIVSNSQNRPLKKILHTQER